MKSTVRYLSALAVCVGVLSVEAAAQDRVPPRAATAAGAAMAPRQALAGVRRGLSPASHPPGAYHPEHVLVRFKPDKDAAARAGAHAAAGALQTLREYHIIPDLVLVRVPSGEVEAALKAYRAHPAVLYATPDRYMQAATTPNDPFFAEQWGLHNTGQTVNGDPGTAGADISAPETWDLWTGAPNFRIAVIDTGVNYLHPDLAPNIWTNPGEIPDNGIDDDGNGYVDDVHGYDFGDDDNDPMDAYGHGSFCAGIIGAAGNDGAGITGVNWHCKIVAVKCVDETGFFRWSSVIAGIQYCIDNGIRISNNSYGGIDDDEYYNDPHCPFREAILAAQTAGHLFITGAANFSHDNDHFDHLTTYPGSWRLANIVNALATTNDDQLADFSSYGRTTVHLGAPGQTIYSTGLGTDYLYEDGTSFATPHVTGVAALVWSRFPNLTWQQVRGIVLDTVRPNPALTGFCRTGGVVNAYNALTRILGDCNGNGVPDGENVSNGTSADCNANGIPDECETFADCNGNGIPDPCEIAAGLAADLNGNWIPDDCEGGCNHNGIPDELEPDCNGNGVPDDCDIANGTSADINGNGIPDECEATVLFVNAAATGMNRGTSWADACTDLQHALTVARKNRGAPVTEIWVARGTYRPDSGTGDRRRWFELIDRVGIYGGFADYETLRSQRNPQTYVTILSGDLAGDDGPPGSFTNYDENSFTLVDGTATAPTAILDGFTIAAGNNTTVPGAVRTGGMFVFAGSCAVYNCRFLANRSDFGGAALSIMGGGTWGDATPVIDACRFDLNESPWAGGAIYGDSSSATYVNCSFSQNHASAGGGAAFLLWDQSAFVGCTFVENATEGVGGAIADTGSAATLVNCVFRGNEAGIDSGAYDSYLGSLSTFATCVFNGNAAAVNAGVSASFEAEPTFVNCTLVHNVAGSLAGGIYVYPASSCTLTNSIAWYNRAEHGSMEDRQIKREGDGAVHVNYCDVQGWTGKLRGRGNKGADPHFVDRLGPDHHAGTADDNLRLARHSPCIDAASNSALPADTLDLDGDGNTSEPLPLDLDGRPRRRDDPAVRDTGEGSPPVVDMGAYERQPGEHEPEHDPGDSFGGTSARGDLNCDGVVDFDDINPFVLALSDQTAYEAAYPNCNFLNGDCNGDGYVDFSDINPFIVLLSGSS